MQPGSESVTYKTSNETSIVNTSLICFKCPLTFKTNSKRKYNHKITHSGQPTGETRVSCEQCKYTAKTVSQLNNHIRVRHDCITSMKVWSLIVKFVTTNPIILLVYGDMWNQPMKGYYICVINVITELNKDLVWWSTEKEFTKLLITPHRKKTYSTIKIFKSK